jgi:hypothetical protein
MTEGEGPDGVAERLSINHSTERSRSRKIGTLCQKKYFETGLKKYCRDQEIIHDSVKL